MNAGCEEVVGMSQGGTKMTMTGAGNGQCLCSSCGERFYSMTAFDMHRAGEFASGRKHSTRRCLSVDEMQLNGMATTAKGVWTTGRHFASDERLLSLSSSR